MTDSPSLSAPPTAELVLRALRRLEPADAVRAAVHLATPVGVALDLQVRLDGAHLCWRGNALRVRPEAPWEQVAAAVVAWARGVWLPDDVPLDLEQDPVTWLKLVRSGARVYLAGSRELFDGQLVSFDVDVQHAAARLVASRVRDGEPMTSGTLYLAGQAVTVRATPHAAHLEV